MIFRLLILIVCLACAVWSSPAAGQWASGGCATGNCPLQNVPRQRSEDQPRLPAVVRISNRQGVTQSLGSGTLVDKNSEHGLVVTCAHLFDDGVGTVVVQFAGGQAYGAKVLEIDRAWDLAALLIQAPSTGPVGIAEAAPRIGTSLQSCGYGADGRLLCNRGRLLQYVTAQGTHTPESFELSGSARQGDSGGPVLDDAQRLVGVLFGTNGQVVAATGCGPVRRFLGRFSSRFRAGQAELPTGGGRAADAPQLPQPAPGASPDSDTAQFDRLGGVERSLAKLEDRLQTAHEHWNEARAAIAEQRESIDASKVRWQDLESRIVDLASHFDGDALRSTIREIVAQGTSANDNSLSTGFWSAAWPLLAGALGLSTPPTAAFVAWKLLRLLIGRARRKSNSPASSKASRQAAATSKAAASSLLNDDYARQLVEVFQHSGRSPVQDATLGREYDEELRRAEASSDGALAKFAKVLRDRVETRFHRIHGLRPAPAEPVDQIPNK